MVLQATLPLSSTDIEAEFTNLERPWGLKDLYRGGDNVPATRFISETIPGLIEEQSIAYSGMRSNHITNFDGINTDEIVTITMDPAFNSGFVDEYAVGVTRSMTIYWSNLLGDDDLTTDEITSATGATGSIGRTRFAFTPRASVTDISILSSAFGSTGTSYEQLDGLVTDLISDINEGASNSIFDNGATNVGIVTVTRTGNDITISQLITPQTDGFLVTGYTRNGSTIFAPSTVQDGDRVNAVRIPANIDLTEVHTTALISLPRMYSYRPIFDTDVSIREIGQVFYYSVLPFTQDTYFARNIGTTNFTLDDFVTDAVAYWNTSDGEGILRMRDVDNVVIDTSADATLSLGLPAPYGITFTKTNNIIGIDFSGFSVTVPSGTIFTAIVNNGIGLFYLGAGSTNSTGGRGTFEFGTTTEYHWLVENGISFTPNDAGPASYTFDLDTQNSSFTGEQSGTFLPNINTTQALTQIASDITTDFPTVTTSIADSVLTIDTNQTFNILQNLVFVQGNGINTMATVAATIEGETSEPASTYTVVDYNNNEVTSFTRITLFETIDHSAAVVETMTDAINSNIETPVDFMGRDEDGQVKILAQSGGAIDNLWSITADHSTGTGDIQFETATRISTGTDPVNEIEQINTSVPESGNISYTDLLGASRT